MLLNVAQNMLLFLNDDVEIANNPLRRIAEVMKGTGAVLGYPFPVSGLCVWLLLGVGC
jgi:hypothetical protein